MLRSIILLKIAENEKFLCNFVDIVKSIKWKINFDKK